MVKANPAQLQKIWNHPKINNFAQLTELLNKAKLQDGAQLLTLLEEAKLKDGAQLNRLLEQPKLANGAQLVALLGHAKLADGAELNTLLGLAKLDSGARLLAFLNDGKVVSGAELITLLNDVKVADSSQVADLLANAKIASAAELIAIIGRVANVAQLVRLLTVHPSGHALLAYLKLNVTQRLQPILTVAQVGELTPPNLPHATAEWITLGIDAGTSGPQTLRELINRGWTMANIRAILTQAHVANGPDNNEMTRLLRWAALYNWPFNRVSRFITYVISTVAGGRVNPAPPWTTVLNWVDTFREHHVGPPGPTSAQVLLHTNDYAGPPPYRVRAYRRATNMNHYYRGHSFEHFSFSNGNINRAEYSSFWPLGTDWATIQSQIDSRAGEPAAIVNAHNATWVFGVTHSSNINNFQVGFKYWRTDFDATLGRDVYDVQLNQFYPKPAPSNLSIHQDVLKGIKALLNK